MQGESSYLPPFGKAEGLGCSSGARPGENPRPRPKDRQMIMDRVKELREIVPNGAKCSIDALLEKTIKYMLFLQSVAKHADTLKDIGEPKAILLHANGSKEYHFTYLTWTRVSDCDMCMSFAF
ncbi:uncharacterized protein A4U43_C08F16350 [Asparagus officinalis]|nr:uncharacterized protein A4U43_C08F16350 [Asparagus officinalis]